MDENKENVKEGIENISNASVDLKDTLGSLKIVSQRIEESEGTIGKLISEDTTYNKINETFTGINNYISRAERFKVFVDYHADYLEEPSEFKNYLTLKLQPNQDKYYFIELIDDPEGRLDITDTVTTTQVDGNPSQTTVMHEEETKDDLKFSIGIAKRYYDLVLRGGIIESTGGLGFDYYLLSDKLRFSFDAYDFNNEDSAHLRASMRVRFLKHLFVTAGYDDFIKHDKDPSYFFGAGFTFRDEDLKYLLTSSPIPQ